MPQAAIGWLVGLGLSQVTATLIVVAAATAITFAANYFLGPKAPKTGSREQGTYANFRSAVYPGEIVYGKTRKGGPIVYMNSNGPDSRHLHMIIALAYHTVESIDDIYIDDQVVTFEGGGTEGWVNSSRWVSSDPDATTPRRIYIKKFLGEADQNVRADLAALTETAGIASTLSTTFYGRRVACLYVKMTYDTEVFASGIPSFSAVVKGKKLYDPRTGLTEYSNNAALVIRDYLTGNKGLDTDDSTINDTAFITAADDCEDSISLDGGGTQNRYTINGTVSIGNSVGSNLGELVASCGGTLYYSQGQFSLKVGVWTAPVKTLTIDDLRSSININTRAGRRDSFNAIYGTFPHQASNYIYTDYPPVTSDVFLAEDGGIENPASIDFNFIPSSARAQRLAKLMLYRAREQRTITADFGMNAFDLEIGDNVYLTLDKYGWSAKEFEVINWRLANGQEGGDLRISLTLKETSSASFDWNAEETEIIANDSDLPDVTYVPEVGITLDTELRIINQEVFGVLLVTADSESPIIDSFEVQYKLSADSTWTNAGTSRQSGFEILPIEDNDYDVRIRGISAFGVYGAWTTTTNFSARPFKDPPSDVENFAISLVGGVAELSWTPVPDLDLSHYVIRYSQATTGATWATSSIIVDQVARPGSSVSVPGKTGTYFIKAIDKLGYKSENAASYVLIADLDTILGLNFVATLTEDPDFAGTKTDIIRTLDGDGVAYITLDGAGTTLFDDISGDFDDYEGLFDAIDLSLSGYYEFDNQIDLGGVFTFHVDPNMTFYHLDYVDSFDLASGLFDDRIGLFDGDTDNNDQSTATIQVAHTQDDPSGSPTWTDWQDVLSSDITARAAKFRVFLETNDVNVVPAISELSVDVDLPDKVRSESDVTFTGQKVVTFSTPFYTSCVPALGLGITGMQTGDYYTVTSKDNEGFTITIYDSTDTQVVHSVTMDYVAKGY